MLILFDFISVKSLSVDKVLFQFYLDHIMFYINIDSLSSLKCTFCSTEVIIKNEPGPFHVVKQDSVS